MPSDLTLLLLLAAAAALAALRDLRALAAGRSRATLEARCAGPVADALGARADELARLRADHDVRVTAVPGAPPGWFGVRRV